MAGLLKYIEIPLRAAFFFDGCWMFSRRGKNLQLLLVKHQVNIISAAVILGGRKQAEAISFNIWPKKQQNARSSLYFEISVEISKSCLSFCISVSPTLHTYSGSLLKTTLNTLTTISCTFYGEPTPNITWNRYGGVLSNGASSNTTVLSANSSFAVVRSLLVFTEVSKADHGTYQCMASNDAGYLAQNISIDVQCKFCFHSGLIFILKLHRQAVSIITLGNFFTVLLNVFSTVEGV